METSAAAALNSFFAPFDTAVLEAFHGMARAFGGFFTPFMRIVTMKRGAKKVKYKAQKMAASSVRKALVKKEFRRISCNAMYIMNGVMGAIMAVLMAVVLLIKRDLIDTLLMQFTAVGVHMDAWTGGILCAVLCMLMSMNLLSAPSISVEGKNLWLMQSLPLPAGEILLSKALVHIVICVPCGLFAGIALALAIRADVITALALIILPALLTSFMALLGVTINLFLPRFDYANDIIAVKQSMSSGIVMFAGMGLVALPVILYTVVFKAAFALHYLYLACAILLALGCLVLYYYLTRSAQKRFDALGQG